MSWTHRKCPIREFFRSPSPKGMKVGESLASAIALRLLFADIVLMKD